MVCVSQRSWSRRGGAVLSSFLAIIWVNEAAFQRLSEWALVWGRSRSTLEGPRENCGHRHLSPHPHITRAGAAPSSMGSGPGGPCRGYLSVSGRRDTVVFR